jgi:hypothetical protein
MKARRPKLVWLACFVLILFVVNVCLQIVGVERHSKAISVPVTFASGVLYVIENGLTRRLLKGNHGMRFRKVAGYSEDPHLLMLLCDTDAGEKYFFLHSGKFTPVPHSPGGYYEVFRYGTFFQPKLDNGDLWVLKYRIDGKLADKVKLHLPGSRAEGYGAIDVSKSGNIAATITDSRGRNDRILLFDKEGKFLCRIGKGYTPSFSPDGKSVAYCTEKIGVVEVCHIPSGSLTRYRAWETF